MKLRFDVERRSTPDPYVFKDNDTYYLYASVAFGDEGVPVYSAKDPLGQWHYEGIAAKFEGAKNYWAPSVIAYGGKYYMYLFYHRYL